MKRRSRSSAELSRRQFIKVAGGLLGGALAYAILAETGKSFVLDLVAQGARATGQREHYWGFVVDANKCIGCGLCNIACKAENNVPPHPECNRTWVERYRITADGEMEVDALIANPREESAEKGSEGSADDNGLPSHPQWLDEAGTDGAWPQTGDGDTVRGFFVPKLCNQCDNPPCVQVCPVSATYKTKDGVVLIDQERCIGCRYCIQACPYGARFLLPDVRTTPAGQVRVVDKCTWCYHRITKGRLPACVEVCPVGARIFGDLNQPDSAVSRILRERKVSVLKPELGTKPKVYYLGLQEGVR